MADETIGTARIDITGDASGIEAAAAKAKSSIASMSKDAQAEYSRLSAAEKRRIDSLIRQADTVGMTRAQQLAYNASLKSSGAVLDDITNRLKANAAATKSVGVEFNKYGLSQKMEAAALRQVPAQITDIIVSLQGGQRPLTVLLQQGGQLKDVFGGVVPALKAMGGALIGMINPVTLSAGALFGLVAAYQAGLDEAEKFNAAVVMTGGYAGVTAGALGAMAKTLGDDVNTTTGKAADALQIVVNTGKITGDAVKKVATAALYMNEATGQAIDKTVDDFVRLAEEPAKASEKLNAQYHYLNAATLERIRTLEDQGNKEEAAALAQRSYSDALRDRSKEVIENVGLMEKAWDGLGRVVSNVWAAMKDVGNNSLQSQLEIARKTLAQMESAGALGRTSPARIAAQKEVIAGLEDQIKAQNDLAAGQARAQQQEEQKARADASWAKIKEQYLSKEERLRAEIAQIERTGKASGASQQEIQDQIARAQEKYKDKSGARSGKKRTIDYDSLDDLIASPDVASRMEAIQRDYNSIANLIGDRLATAQQKYSRELADLGRGDWARSLTHELQGIEDKYNSILEQRRNSSKGLSNEDEKRIKDAMDRELELARQHYADMKEAQSIWLLGASEGLANYAESSANVYRSVGQMVGDSFKGMEDALTSFVTTGKLSFSDLANSIINDMVRIAIQQSVTGPLAGAAGGWLSGLFGGGGWTDAQATNLMQNNVVPSAKGNVFNSPSLSRYSNQIHDTPQYFQFAKGAGVFAEAGPEAIMPLKRGPDGRLGVSATSGSAAPNVQVNVINQSSQPVQAKQGPLRFDAIRGWVQDVILTDNRVNGPITKSMRGAMGA